MTPTNSYFILQFLIVAFVFAYVITQSHDSQEKGLFVLMEWFNSMENRLIFFHAKSCFAQFSVSTLNYAIQLWALACKMSEGNHGPLLWAFSRTMGPHMAINESPLSHRSSTYKGVSVTQVPEHCNTQHIFKHQIN